MFLVHIDVVYNYSSYYCIVCNVMRKECTLGSELLTTDDLGISFLSQCGQVSVNMTKPSYQVMKLQGCDCLILYPFVSRQ